MEKLIEELDSLIQNMNSNPDNSYDLDKELLEDLHSVYPFNKFEFMMSHLLGTRTISIEQYLEIRNKYLERNKYLHVFEITAPRTFGEAWAQKHLSTIVPELKNPSKEYDPNYSGQYDFWYHGVRIEVKASRAVRRKSGGSLISKALSSDSGFGFSMNFQQIKPQCCDVFVWIAVWKDVIRYWVLSSGEVLKNRYYSAKQHRGNEGEGQIWLKETNIAEFKSYEVDEKGILSAILKKSGKFD